VFADIAIVTTFSALCVDDLSVTRSGFRIRSDTLLRSPAYTASAAMLLRKIAAHYPLSARHQGLAIPLNQEPGGNPRSRVSVRGSWLSAPNAQPITEIAADSPLEQAGFELAVPP
jgi:hypothetical protein